MTEESFQQARKVMQSANVLRGLITKQKGEVAKWTKIEDCFRRDGKQAQADGAKKCLEKALLKLDELRRKFNEMSFPDPNMVRQQVESVQCENCGERIAKGNTYCGECLCED